MVRSHRNWRGVLRFRRLDVVLTRGSLWVSVALGPLISRSLRPACARHGGSASSLHQSERHVGMDACASSALRVSRVSRVLSLRAPLRKLLSPPAPLCLRAPRRQNADCWMACERGAEPLVVRRRSGRSRAQPALKPGALPATTVGCAGAASEPPRRYKHSEAYTNTRQHTHTETHREQRQRQTASLPKRCACFALRHVRQHLVHPSSPHGLRCRSCHTCVFLSTHEVGPNTEGGLGFARSSCAMLGAPPPRAQLAPTPLTLVVRLAHTQRRGAPAAREASASLEA